MHNLSFWEVPDWQRESTFSPIFIIFATVAAFFLVAAALTSLTWREKKASQATLFLLQKDNELIADKALDASRQKAALATWQKVLANAREIELRRLPWSRQLEALQGVFPDEVIVQDLSVNRRRMPPLAGDKVLLPRWSYSLTMNAIADGDNAMQILNDLMDRIKRDPLLSNWQSLELRNIQSRGRSQSFTIVCQISSN